MKSTRPPWRHVALAGLLTTAAWAQPALRGPYPVVRDSAQPELIEIAERGTFDIDVRLLVVAGEGATAAGWATAVSERTARLNCDTELAVGDGPLRVWVWPHDVLKTCQPQWPAGAQLIARIDTLAPGLRGAWLRAGRRAGITSGDAFWVRVAGQPIARLDVRLVEDSLCYAAITPLVSNVQLHRGDEATAWPAPGLARRGVAESAIVHIEKEGARERIWIAAPPRPETIADAQAEIFRAGAFIGLLQIDRQDERFWYGQVAARRPVAGASPAADTKPHAAAVQTQPAVVSSGPPRIGDEVRLRTRRQIQERTFAARVFDVTAEGLLINAGDADGLREGETGAVYRGARRIGAVAVQRLQSSYSLMTPDAEAEENKIAPDDEVWFSARPPAASVVGRVERIMGERILSIAPVSNGAGLPLHTPLALRAGEKTIGVALLLEQSGQRAIGIALAESLAQAPTVGVELIWNGAN